MAEAVNLALATACGCLALAAVAWLVRAADRAEAEEDKALEKNLAALPEEVRLRLWAAHFRARAERDLY